MPCPPPGDLPDPGIELESLTSPALPDRLFTTSATWEAPFRGPSPQEKQTDMPGRGHLGLAVLPAPLSAQGNVGTPNSHQTPHGMLEAGARSLPPTSPEASIRGFTFLLQAISGVGF